MNTININRKKISSTEIERFKNFQSILKGAANTQKKAKANKILKVGTPIATIAIGSVLAWYFLVQKIVKPDEVSTPSATAYFINPPLPQCNIPYLSVVYYNTSDTVIFFKEHSKVKIKRNSLVDSAGNAMAGPIEIRYREFMNPAEIFLSGIPMEYDSSGTTSIFESAGMIEIAAFKQNRALYIAPDKPVTIAFMSRNSSSTFNLYQLDTANRNWVYKGKDKIGVLKNKKSKQNLKPDNTQRIVSDSLKLLSDEIAELHLQKPVPPVLASNTKWHFKLDVLVNEFPELAVFKNTVFEIDEHYKPLNPMHPAIVWDDAIIEKSDKAMSYFVTFKKDTSNIKYLVYPVLTGNDYAREMLKYERKFETYQNELTRQKLAEAQLRERMTKTKTVRLSNTSFIDYNEVEETEQLAIRSFQIMNFGIWNVDKQMDFDNNEFVKAIVTVNDTIYNQKVWLLDFSRNAVFIIYPENRFRYNKQSNNMLIMVTGKNQIAVLKPEDFAQIPKNKAIVTLQLSRVNTNINSVDDFLESFRTGFAN